MEHNHDYNHHPQAPHHSFTRLEGLRIGFVFLIISLSWLPIWGAQFQFKYIEFFATIVGGYPIFKEALSALLERKMTMELSMTIALIAALAIGEFFTSLVIVLFVLIAETLEGLTIERGRLAIRNLMNFMPKEVFIRHQSYERKTSISKIKIGDTIIVKPGGRIPVDGIVTKGFSFIDQSAISGESMPIEKTVGSEVYAGSINQSGAIDIETRRIGKDTAFGQIIEIIEKAEKSRPPIQRIADRLSAFLVYFAMGAAILTYLLTADLHSTISVIIVAGACGVAAGTPLAILGAIGMTARKGVVVKGGLYIESLSKIDTVVFDKTGTLSYGKPEIVEICPVSGVTEKMLLETAAIAERLSEHAFAKTILKKADHERLTIVEPERFTYTPGKGIICWSHHDKIIVGNLALFHDQKISTIGIKPSQDFLTDVFVARNDQFLGVIRFSDIIRHEAHQVISTLKKMGLKTILLTGDNLKVANAIGKQLGIDQIEAEMLPDKKAKFIRELCKTKKIAMVGDGINDAPSLVEADVGIAMGTGTDIARESANIILLGNNLCKLVETIKIAKRCHKIIMTNFLGTILIDTLGIILAAFGFLSPTLAALIHVSSELLFLLNSARLLPTLSLQKESDHDQHVLDQEISSYDTSV